MSNPNVIACSTSFIVCVTHAHLKPRDDDCLEKFPLTYNFTIKKWPMVEKVICNHPSFS